MIVEKAPDSGAWVVYRVVNGYLETRTYYGYTKREAVRRWREAVK